MKQLKKKKFLKKKKLFRTIWSILRNSQDFGAKRYFVGNWFDFT